MVIWWFVAFIVLLFIEIITVNLVTIWFAIGAIAATIVANFTDSIIIQTIVFIIVSLISLLLTKPIANKLKKTQVIPTNSDRVIGKVGEVTKKITSDNYGEVKVYGNVWTAMSDADIEVGEKVKIMSIDGVKLIVKKEDK